MADNDTGADTDRNTRVFISYAREDQAFVDRLEAALRRRGIEAFVDRSDIEAFAIWRQRIEQLIGAADTIVFVLTPRSAQSQSCGRELELAVGLNKRLAPLVLREVEDGLVPPALQAVNYVFCRERDDFERAVDALAVGLETDIGWIRDHTRLGELARRWDATRRPDDRLLHGEEVIDARAWIGRRPRHAPEPTELHRRFVEASVEQHERRRHAEWARASAYQESVQLLIRSGAFAQARRELDEAIAYLAEIGDRELSSRRGAWEARRRDIARLADFQEQARATYVRSGEEEFAAAREACEQALTTLGVLGHEQWWLHLPAAELDQRQVEALKHEAHRQLMLLGALRLQPGIDRITPKRSAGARRGFSVASLLRFVPARAIAAFARAGGLDRLLRRLDNPQAAEDFRAALALVSKVEAFEAAHAAQAGAAFPPSHTAGLLRRLCEALLAVASGPKGSVIGYQGLLDLAARHPVPAADAPLNPADYYFLGLFNFFIAKRGDSTLAKVVGLLQPLFPDLDSRTPYDTAERLLRAGVSREPENFWPHFVLGRTLLSGEDYSGAELAFNVCIAVDPSYARGFEQRALALAGQWRRRPHPDVLRRAQEDSLRALELAAEDPSTWWPRGEFLEWTGRTAEALDAFTRWMALEEAVLGRMSRSSGVQKAFDLAARTLRSSRGTMGALHANAYALQAFAHFLWSNHADAAASAAKALAIDPGHAHARLVQALLPAEGNAIAAFEAIAAADPGIWLARLRQAEACERQSDQATACAAWRRLDPPAGSAVVPPAWMRSQARAALSRLQPAATGDGR